MSPCVLLIASFPLYVPSMVFSYSKAEVLVKPSGKSKSCKAKSLPFSVKVKVGFLLS